MKRLAVLLALLGIYIWASPAASLSRYDPRGAYISLHAKWNATPILLETAEFLVRVPLRKHTIGPIPFQMPPIQR